MSRSDAPVTHFIAYEDLVDRLRGIFMAHGCAQDVARLLSENCAAAERDGALSHGLFRLPGYISTLESGWVDGKARPSVESAAPSFLRVDGKNGFTLSALAAGRDRAVDMTRRNGVAVLAIRNSHHLGALSLDVEPFADEGLFALSVINSMKSVVPFDGRAPVFGTNPIAYAAPRLAQPSLVVDFATSSMAHGDVQIAAREGRGLPAGSGVDSKGCPTDDPQAVLDGGALLTFGGYKGGALAMLVELMCAALGGGKFSHEVDLARHPGAATPHTGQTFILIDPDAGRGRMSGFVERVETLVGAIDDAGATRLPGDRRIVAREAAARRGIPVDENTMRMLRGLRTAEP